jgi:hypothetical protein
MSRRHRAAENPGQSESTDPQAHLSELDEVAGEPRDIGQLSEPLADSVLDYTLQRLKPSEDVPSPIVQAPEKPPVPDDLSQLMDEPSNFSHSNSSSQLTRENARSLPSAFDQQNSDGVAVAQTSPPWERWRAPAMPFLNPTGYEWWELGLDNTQQPILPYDELFNLDFAMA